MSQTNSSSRLAPWQAMTMLAVGIAIIFFGLMALKVNARIVLAVDGAIMCLMACAFGISYDSVQKGIKDTIASMLVAMLILLSVGVLIGSWMASGTIPVMVYYGMQVITPALFLPVACILCTLMSTLAGTSWLPSALPVWASVKASESRLKRQPAQSAWVLSSAIKFLR